MASSSSPSLSTLAFANSPANLYTTAGAHSSALRCAPCRRDTTFLPSPTLPRPSHCTPHPLHARATATAAGGGGVMPPIPGDGPGKEQDSTFLERIRLINKVSDAPTEDQVTSLISLARTDPNAQVRYTALSRLSNVDVASPGVQQHTDDILAIARNALQGDSEPSCRSAAADLIAGLRLNDGFDDLVAAFNNDSADWVLKFSICAGVGYMRHPQSYDFLSSVLAQKKVEWKEDEIKQQKIAAGELPPPPPPSPTDLVPVDDSLLVAACVGALGDLGDQRALPLVKEFIAHPDSAISERAKHSCDQLEAAQK